MRNFFTRKSAKDEIKTLLDRALNLYEHNYKGSNISLTSFSDMVARLKNLVEANVREDS